jgi:MFS family permease
LTLVAILSDGSGLAVSLFLLVRMVPPLLVTPFAGVLADTFNRKKLLIIADISRVGIVMTLLLFGQESLPLIYILTGLQFAVTAVFDPTKLALLPNVLKRDDLVNANTLESITWSAMLAVGAILGGIVAGVFGVTIALLIDAGTYLISALLIRRVNVPENIEVQLDDDESLNTKGFRDGLNYAKVRPTLLASIWVKAGGSIGNIEAIMAILATQYFVIGANGEQSLGIMYGAIGVGAVLGPVVLNHFHDNSIHAMHRMITIGYILLVVGMVILSNSAFMWIALLGLIVGPMGGSGNWTYSTAIIQKSAANHMMGRMFSLERIALQFVSIISTLLTGWLIDYLGASQIFLVIWIIATLRLIPLLGWWITLRKLNRPILAKSFAS